MCNARQIPLLMWLTLRACGCLRCVGVFSRSVCALAGSDGQPEQRAGGQRPSSHLALYLHHQRRPQQSVHHLDGDAAGQRPSTRAGNRLHIICYHDAETYYEK